MIDLAAYFFFGFAFFPTVDFALGFVAAWVLGFAAVLGFTLAAVLDFVVVFAAGFDLAAALPTFPALP